MKKWIALIAVLLALLLAYAAAGPYMTIRAIRHAVVAQDAGELAEQVDFPSLRASLKAQLLDAVVREAGDDLQSSAMGTIALTLMTGVVNGTVDGMVNPAGLSAGDAGAPPVAQHAGQFPPPRRGRDRRTDSAAAPGGNRCTTRRCTTNPRPGSPRPSATRTASPSCSC
jgi:hypothetical protein